MSSLVRRIQIRRLKRIGFTRNPWIMVKNARGDLVPEQVRRGGEITDAEDTPIGRRWPTLLPSIAA